MIEMRFFSPIYGDLSLALLLLLPLPPPLLLLGYLYWIVSVSSTEDLTSKCFRELQVHLAAADAAAPFPLVGSSWPSRCINCVGMFDREFEKSWPVEKLLRLTCRGSEGGCNPIGKLVE